MIKEFSVKLFELLESKKEEESGPSALALGMGLHVGLPKDKKPQKEEADSGSANVAQLRGEKKPS